MFGLGVSASPLSVSGIIVRMSACPKGTLEMQITVWKGGIQVRGYLHFDFSFQYWKVQLSIYFIQHPCLHFFT